MKKLIYMFAILFSFAIYSCSSGGDDDGMSPSPEPDPVADFTVRAATKTANHPWANQGHSVAFTINGNEGVTLNLTRGTTYVFDINTPSHPFYISTNDTGEGEGEITDGVTGGMTTNGTLSFTPNSNHPDMLYYQCSVHPNMGYIIILTDP